MEPGEHVGIVTGVSPYRDREWGESVIGDTPGAKRCCEHGAMEQAKANE